MKTRTTLWAVVLIAVASSTRAGDYTFDIPQLLGHYLGDIPAIPTIEVEVDLGMEFAEIRSAALQLSGTHAPGLVGDLNSEHTFKLPAEVLASFDGPDRFSNVFIDKLLPSQSGAFEINEPFRVGHFATGPPDFSPWLDGVAEFQFWVTPPPMLAIYYLIDMPSVTITSATLVIEGQPNLDEFMLRGDFDGNGTVDGGDLLAWQRNPTVGSLSEWQAGYGAGVAAGLSSSIIPEPATMVIAIAVLAAVLHRKLR